jgi:hypothetical protein
MSNYTKLTNFATKDALSSGSPAKIVSGTEIDTELNAIQVASATKVEKNNGTHTGSTVFSGTVTAAAVSGTFTGNITGNVTGNVTGNLTGDVTGNTSGTAATVTTAAQPAITSVGTLTSLVVTGDVSSNGAVIGFPSGTRMLFQQTAAPTGWTKDITKDNHALQVVSGTVTTGGSVNFETAFANQGVSGSVGSTALSIANLPAHTHTLDTVTSGGSNSRSGVAEITYTYSAGSSTPGATITSETTNATGSGSGHTHSFSGTSINLDVKYADVIIAQKD